MSFLSGLKKDPRNSPQVSTGAVRSAPGGDRRIWPRMSWGNLLVVFMRLLAMVWIAQALAQWSAVLLPSQPLFDKVSQLWGGAVIFFAVLDPVAAVGLWLATPWGGVLWLFSAIAQILVAAAVPGFFSIMWIVANIVLIVVYFGLTWQAGHIDPASGAPR
ncbi:DUF6163 family protein [Methylocapsa palsarum]|uniref:DoxX-like family protein n=1 Tax=Methylocapsa palsarum TaxID=1612308 RepID=A0A1I3WW60_9HYPH|nr:DUF6163 family protein [Methylocapsa palsarum]SFK11754.1 hypothetical protein SAMN05444581_102192 [Methylocapsa palsarum]